MYINKYKNSIIRSGSGRGPGRVLDIALFSIKKCFIYIKMEKLFLLFMLSLLNFVKSNFNKFIIC